MLVRSFGESGRTALKEPGLFRLRAIPSGKIPMIVLLPPELSGSSAIRLIVNQSMNTLMSQSGSFVMAFICL